MKRRKTSRDRLGNTAVQESGKAAVYAFRLAPVLVKRIDALAKAAGQTRNQWVRSTLRRGVGW